MKGKSTGNYKSIKPSPNSPFRRKPVSILTLKLLDALAKLFKANNEVSDREKKPVEEQRGGNQKPVTLALHDRFLMAKVLHRRAGVLLVARRPRLVLPVDVH